MRVRILDRFRGHSGVPFGSLLGAFWAPWGHFGPPWAALGELGGDLGAICAHLLGGLGVPWRFGLENRARAPKSYAFECFLLSFRGFGMLFEDLFRSNAGILA